MCTPLTAVQDKDRDDLAKELPDSFKIASADLLNLSDFVIGMILKPNSGCALLDSVHCQDPTIIICSLHLFQLETDLAALTVRE